MKKIFLLLIVFYSSCYAPKFTLGTSENEFIRSCKSCKLVESSAKRTVYKWGTPGIGDGKYYYFSSGKLFRIDEGVNQADIKIDVDNK